MSKNILAIGIVFLFFVSAVAPMTFGYNVKIQNEKQIIENYDSYHVTEITSYAPHISCEYIKNNDTSKSNQVDILKKLLNH